MIVTYNKVRYSVTQRERCIDGMCTLIEADTTVPRTKVVPCRNIEWPARTEGDDIERLEAGRL